MSRAVLEILALILIVYFASGAWAAGRRPRVLTERDYRRAEKWRAGCENLAPGEDPLLRAADLAFLDSHEPAMGGEAQSSLPSDDQKA